MFGLGFLFLVALYFLGIGFVSKVMPGKVKKYFIAVAFLLPITYPYWYLAYPSYQGFQSLCGAPDRYVILKTQDVAYVYSDSGCHHAYKITKDRAFKGYECEMSRKTDRGSDGYEKKLFRYSRNNNWNSPSCQDECVKRGYYANWEEICQAQCFNETEISAPSFKYESSSIDTAIIPGRLIETRQAKTNEKGEDLAVLKNYTYYPYGKGWATILGGASGSPPSMQCKKKYDLYRYDFLIPTLK